jgi:NADH:ubiquinone oxidoreductase subunit K
MNEPGLYHYLVFSVLLFGFGLYGLLTRRNLIALLMAIELVLNAAALNFVAFHRFRYAGAVAGAVFPLFIIAVAAAEAAVVLAIIIVWFRQRSHLDIETATQLRH